MTTDLVLPKWEVLLQPAPPISADAYLAWLADERNRLIETGELKKIQSDPARCPVDARFIL
jgi:hypothetical protein